MADFDVLNDTKPALKNKKADHFPKIADMKTALKGKSSTTYSDARLSTMTKNDLIYACRAEGVTVTGLV